MDTSSDLIEKYSSGELDFNAFTGLVALEATKGMFKLIAEVNNMTEEQLNEQPEVAAPSQGQKDVVDLALEHDTSTGSQELQKGLALLRAEAIQKIQPKIMALTMAFMLNDARG